MKPRHLFVAVLMALVVAAGSAAAALLSAPPDSAMEHRPAGLQASGRYATDRHAAEQHGTGQHGTAQHGADHHAAGLQFKGEPMDLGASPARVGELIANRPYIDLHGNEGTLWDASGENGLVVVLRDVNCPVSRKYGARLARIEDEFSGRGFGFLYLNVNLADTPEAAAEEIDAYGFDAPYVLDPSSPIARSLEATTSTEVFVLDRARTLTYRGAVDDQYGIGFTKPVPTDEYLLDALASVEAGVAPEVKGTIAPGCYLSLDAVADLESPEITYHNRISRIVQAKCQQCHRPTGAGPFPMMAYDDVYARRQMIQFVLSDGIMPPWYADRGTGPWGNDFSLAEQEIADFVAWIQAGSPEGDPADAPVPRTYADKWTIGEPDAVFRIDEPFEIPAEGQVDYQYTYVKTDFAEDRWVKAMEILPTAPQVTHHVLVFIESPDVRQRLRDAETEEEERAARAEWQGGIDGYFASMVPGQAGIRFPDGMAKKLPAGAWLKFQLHYTANGREAVDQSEIGFIFTEDPVRTEVRTDSAFDTEFVIPAGATEHRVTATYEFGEDADLLSLFPHTHLRGTEFYFELIYPDGEVEAVLPISRYDFNWQLNYEFAEPKRVPAGTTMRVTGVFDNSDGNPANPNSRVDVGFGEQTWEEMLIGYVNWVPARR